MMARIPIIAARPLTRKIPSMKIVAMPNTNQRYSPKMNPSARASSHSFVDSGNITSARVLFTNSGTETKK